MSKILRKKSNDTVVVSGGFDPLHIGHVRMFNEAKKLGDILIVVINNDNWLLKKKGFVFMPENERLEIIQSLKSIDKVVLTKHKKDPTDMSVTHMLEILKPNIFANGGDRNPKQLPVPGSEMEWCKKNNCKMVYNVGRGGKVQSSSVLAMNLLADLAKHKKCPCGSNLLFSRCGILQSQTHKANLKKLLNKA